MKICVKCKIDKEDSNFYLQPSGYGKKRLCSWCIDCTKKYATERLKRVKLDNPELVSERRKLHKRNNKVKNLVDNRKRARDLKRKCVDYAGGKCISCGYNKYIAALDFHHIDPTNKNFPISRYTTVWSKIVEELAKCVLLCSNCHRAVHSGELDLNNKIDECSVSF